MYRTIRTFHNCRAAIMQSKREPPCLLELSQVYRQRPERFNTDRCSENSIHPFSERVERRNIHQSSQLGMEGQGNAECHHGMAHNYGTDKYRRQRNGEWYVGNECDIVSGPTNSESGHNMVELFHFESHVYKTRRYHEWCMGNEDILMDTERKFNHRYTQKLHSTHHKEAYQNGKSNRQNSDWYMKKDLKNISEKCSPTIPSVSLVVSSDQTLSEDQSPNKKAAGTLVLYQTAPRRMKSLPQSQQPPNQPKEEPKQLAKETRGLRLLKCSSQPSCVSVQHTSGQPMRNSTLNGTDQVAGHPARIIVGVPIQNENLGYPQIQRPPGQSKRETRSVLTRQISEKQSTESTSSFDQLRKETRIPILQESLEKLHIQNPSGLPATETLGQPVQASSTLQLHSYTRLPPIQQTLDLHRSEQPEKPAVETTWVPPQQCSVQRVRKTKLAPIKQTLGQLGCVPAPPAAEKPTIRTSSQQTEQASSTLKSYTTLPPIKQTFDLSQSETKPPAIQETARSCQEPTRNKQSNERTLARNVRRQGRQEVYPAGGYCHTRRQGVCKQTDKTKVERTFVRVLNKRF